MCVNVCVCVCVWCLGGVSMSVCVSIQSQKRMMFTVLTNLSVFLTATDKYDMLTDKTKRSQLDHRV